MKHAKRAENEINTMSYEIFLKRGFQFNKSFMMPHKSELANLINCENGIEHKFLPTREKQLFEIKNRLKKAIELIIKNLDLDELNEKALSELLPEIINAQSSIDINKIIESGIYFSQEHK